MGFTGDIAELGKLVDNLGRLASVPSQVAADASERIAGLIAQEFEAQADPYGDAWADHTEGTVKRWGEHEILDLSGGMRGSVDVRPMRGAGIAITIDDVAGFHQGGTVDMVARPVLPSDDMPPLWEEALEAAGNARFAEAMG